MRQGGWDHHTKQSNIDVTEKVGRNKQQQTSDRKSKIAGERRATATIK
ncbi:Uncharacterised protein [Vibrio cholerae]|nr:Uncharacterised protein [Vibrio cholerae]